MAGITEAKDCMRDFFVKKLNKELEALRVITVGKTDEGWAGRFEITETNIYLKKIGYPPVYDQNIYSIKMDEDLNVVEVKQENGETEE